MVEEAGESRHVLRPRTTHNLLRIRRETARATRGQSKKTARVENGDIRLLRQRPGKNLMFTGGSGVVAEDGIGRFKRRIRAKNTQFH